MFVCSLLGELQRQKEFEVAMFMYRTGEQQNAYNAMNSTKTHGNLIFFVLAVVSLCVRYNIRIKVLAVRNKLQPAVCHLVFLHSVQVCPGVNILCMLYGRELCVTKGRRV